MAPASDILAGRTGWEKPYGFGSTTHKKSTNLKEQKINAIVYLTNQTGNFVKKIHVTPPAHFSSYQIGRQNITYMLY